MSGPEIGAIGATKTQKYLRIGAINRTLLLLLLGLWITSTSAMVQAQTLTFPKLTGRVVDEAAILRPSDETKIASLLAAIEASTGHQIAVATIADLQGQDIADYSYQLGRAWGVGDKKRNDGVLLVIAPKSRRINISVGYGLEPVLTDALSGRIIRQVIAPHFKQGDYVGGITAGVEAIGTQLGLPPEQAQIRARQVGTLDGEKSDFAILAMMVFAFFVVIPFRIWLWRKRVYRRYGAWDSSVSVWGSKSGFGGSGGGGFGGLGGGGFGGFGGGGFGGGGASGGW